MGVVSMISGCGQKFFARILCATLSCAPQPATSSYTFVLLDLTPLEEVHVVGKFKGIIKKNSSLFKVSNIPRELLTLTFAIGLYHNILTSPVVP